MPALMPPQTVLTPADAANQLQARGLDALGLVAPNLSSGWADATPVAGSVDASALRLTLTNPRAPFRAPLRIETTPTIWSDVQGDPVAGPAAVLRLHPEAERRLARLVEARLGAPQVRPLPVAMLVHASLRPPRRRRSTGTKLARRSGSPDHMQCHSTTCAGCRSTRWRSRRCMPS